MAGRIKGITIEIGGDTSRLNKALADSDKELKGIEKQLKTVERNLKLDPTNIDLLRQRQELLAEKTGELTKQQAEYKKVLESTTPDDAKWAEWENVQASLTTQIKETQRSLVDLKKERDSLADLGFSADSAQIRELDEQIQRLTEKEEGLRIEAEQTYDQLGRPIPTEEYKKAENGLANVTVQLKEAKKASDEANPSLERFAAAADKVSDKANAAAQATKGLSTAGAAVAGGIAALAVSAGKTADELNTLSKQSGFSTELIQQWRYAADLIDVDADAIIAAAQRMKRNMTSTSADVVAAWERLGISVKDNNGQLRDAESVFRDVTIGLSLVANETERDTLAMTLLGRGADELAGIIDDGGRALREYGQQAKDMGLILSQDALDGANAFNDGLDTIKAKAKAAFTSAGADLAESLLPALERLVDIVSRVLLWFSNLDAGTMKTIAVIGGLVAAISPIAKLVSGVSGAISGVSAVAKVFNSVAGTATYLTFVKWAAIILAVVAALTLLIAAIATLTGKGRDLQNALTSYGGAMSGAAGSVLGGNVGAQALTNTGAGSAYNGPTGMTVGTLTRTIDRTPVNGRAVENIIELDGATLARQMYNYNQAEAVRRGTAAVN